MSLCRRHQRAAPEEDFGLTLDAYGEPRSTQPAVRPLPTAPPPLAWTGVPLARSRKETG